MKTKSLEGTTVVAYETLENNNKEVAIHADIEDEGQSVSFPKVRTTATDKKNGTHEQEAAANVTIVDVVKYSNLKVGKEYTISGILMDKSTGKELTFTRPVLDEKGKIVYDKDGKMVMEEYFITAEKSFTPEKPDDEVTLEFTFNSAYLAGKTIVVFEKLFRDEVEVGVHADIEDEEQSVNIIQIGTTLTDKAKGGHEASTGNMVELVDTISYKGLTPGKEYRVSGVLMDKATGKPVVQNGKEATASAVFTPTKADDVITVTFVINADALQGHTLVAFEELYNGASAEAVLIAEHKDMNDTAQTVTVPEEPPIPPLGLEDAGTKAAMILFIAGLMLASIVLAAVIRRRKNA